MVDIMDYEIFSLPAKEVKIINKERYNETSFLLWIKSKVIKVQCTKCWWYNTKRIGKWYNEQIVNHIFLSNYLTVKLKLYKRKFICMDCDKKWWNTFIEWFSFIEKNCSYTDTYAQFILREREYSSLSELSRKFKVSETLIYKVIDTKNIDDLILDKIGYMQTLDEIYLWVDEVSFLGHDMICTITEVKQRKVLGVLETRKKVDLIARLDKIDTATLKKIKWIATDMNATYKKTIQEYIAKRTWVKVPEIGAKAVADHFHLVQMMMKLIIGILNMTKRMIKAGHYGDEIKDLCDKETVEAQKYRTDKLEWTQVYVTENEDYKPITLWYFITKKYNSLLTMKKENHTQKQEDRIRQIFTEFDPCGYLQEARIWKELMLQGIQDKSIDLIDELIEVFKNSKHYLLQKAAKTLRNRRIEIENFFELWITNAFTEWKNTKVKLFKRMAYGYLKKENYMKRLLLCL